MPREFLILKKLADFLIPENVITLSFSLDFLLKKEVGIYIFLAFRIILNIILLIGVLLTSVAFTSCRSASALISSVGAEAATVLIKKISLVSRVI
jgi:hypothetical protein